MSYWPNPTLIQIGSQTLADIGDRLRFVIHDILPVRGFYGQFGIRDRIIEEAIKRAKPLEVLFEQREDWSILQNPIAWKAMGKVKKQVGYYKDRPMTFYWYFLDKYGRLTKEKQQQEQEVLFL